MTRDIVEAYFKKQYTNNPYIIKSPGRINIIGEHTDYNLGYALPASIEKSIYFAINKNNSLYFQIEAFLAEPEKITLSINGKGHSFNSFWGNYFEAILHILVERKYPIQGLDCVFGGNIPIGFGLSSSAALCCGFTYAVSVVLDIKIPREEIALIAQEAEHKIGLNCGLMDQYAVLFGKKSHALFLDCKDLSYAYIPINLKGYSWILINSNIKHELAVDSEYNLRRKSCEEVVQKLKKANARINSLRDVSIKDLMKIKNLLPETNFKRALHVIQENERVLKMIDALKTGNAQLVGSILLEGHISLSTKYEVSTKELDFLVEISQKQEGVLGSRMMGGGFGGCTINLIKHEYLATAVKDIIEAYRTQTGIEAVYTHLEIGDSVQLLSS
ncbi:galactokinase [Sediminicola arcticus]|jgi:galactokinase|uniref:Galactokinase n=1 Tax=Sediminicola arcticus TaxID=1574308 RepID=A0ABV2SUS1_9FLAO